ncbi:MAG: hypothetical protein AABX05_05885 [Nanoarchaeota archaeon]
MSQILKEFPLYGGMDPNYTLCDVVPKALSEGYKLADIPTIAQALLNGNLNFRDNHISGDLVLQHYQKGIKLVRGDGSLWKKIHPNASTPHGVIKLEEELYAALDVQEFSMEQLKKWSGNILGHQTSQKNKVSQCPLWREAFHNDIPLLEAFAEESFRQLELYSQEWFQRSIPANRGWMGVSAGETEYPYPILSLWSLGSVEFPYMLNAFKECRYTFSPPSKIVGIR